MTILITLSAAGIDTGSFNLYSSPNGLTFTLFESGISRDALIVGYTSSLVPNGTGVIRVMSNSICTNYIDLLVTNGTTTTTSSTSSTSSTSTTSSTSSTTSSTTTPAPVGTPLVVKYLSNSGTIPITCNGYALGTDACTNGPSSTFSKTVYYSGTFGNGTILYNNSNLTDQFLLTTPGFLFTGGYSFYLGTSVDSYTVCPSSTISINWLIRGPAGGRLIIVDGNGSQVLNRVSEGSDQTGTIVLSGVAATGVTVTGQSYGAYVVRYLVCNNVVGGNIFASGPITPSNSVSTGSLSLPSYSSVNMEVNSNLLLCPEA